VMRNSLNPFQGLFSKNRIKRKRAVINDPGGENLELSREEIVTRTETGDFESLETINSLILKDGQKVTSHLEILGKCVDCGNYVTLRSMQYCPCGKVICLSCSKFWKPENQYLCKDCYKKERCKKFWATVLAIIIKPFIKRENA